VSNVLEREAIFSYQFTQDSTEHRHSNSFQLVLSKELGSKEGREFVVGPGQTVGMEVIFKPKSLANYEARLVISNQTTTEEFDYEITGVVEESSTNEKLLIECHAGATSRHSLRVVNPTLTVIQYKVTTDLPSYDGPTLYSAVPGPNDSFAFSLRPLRIGKTMGFIELK
jgi:hypothetical protein